MWLIIHILLSASIVWLKVSHALSGKHFSFTLQLRTVSKRNQPKSSYDYVSTFKAEHIIYLDELTCELSMVEARVSAFHVKICQSTNISKAGLILEDIDFFTA